MTDLFRQAIYVAFWGYGLAYMMAVLDGPFGFAAAVRALLQKSFWPGWVIEGADCVFCWSFSICLVGALFLAPDLLAIEVVKSWLIGYGLVVFLFKWTGH